MHHLFLVESLALIEHEEFQWIDTEIRALDKFIHDTLMIYPDQSISVYRDSLLQQLKLKIDRESFATLLDKYCELGAARKVYVVHCPNHPGDVIAEFEDYQQKVNVECELCNGFHVFSTHNMVPLYIFDKTKEAKQMQRHKDRLLGKVECYPKKKLKVLVMGADARRSKVRNASIDIDEELKQITEKIQNAHGSIEVLYEPAVGISDFIRAMEQYKPDIVHFSGHSNSKGICLIDRKSNASNLLDKDEDYVTNEKLDKIFQNIGDSVVLVVLNSCNSIGQSEVILRHVPFLVGTTNAVNSDDAMRFASNFYQSIGFGQSLDQAYRRGILEVVLEDGSNVFSVNSSVENKMGICLVDKSK